MRNIVIYGAGGFGREVAEIVRRHPNYQLIGFIDDKLNNTKVNGIKVFSLDEFEPYDDNVVMDDIYYNRGLYFVVAIGDPEIRKKCVKKCLDKQLKPAILIDPSVIAGYDVEVGEGSIICPNTVLTCNIRIGKYSIINQNCSIGHDCLIWNYVTINPLCGISGNVEINNNVYIGGNSFILQGKEIDANSKIGAGAVVLQHIPSNVTAVGVPAKVVK